MWTATLNRLPTRARLVSWGMQVSSLCVLCSNHIETRDHLFLSCAFSEIIWKESLTRISLPTLLFSSWNDLLSWTMERAVSSPSTLRKLLAQAVINGIWRQRNNLLHNSVTVPPLILFKDIDREIINSINARRNRTTFKDLMGFWLR